MAAMQGQFVSMFSQLGAVSAVLGGFAFTALMAMLAGQPARAGRSPGLTVAATAVSAACFILCAMTWALASVKAGALPAVAGPSWVELNLLHARMSLAFYAGTLMLFAGLGCSGWVRSRRLGAFTAAVAVLAGVAAVAVLRLFAA